MTEKLKRFGRYLLETPDANSRFIFLVTGLFIALGLVALVIGFMYSHNERYPDMIYALGGAGGGGNALGRALTKFAGGKQEPPLQVDAESHGQPA